VAAPVGERCAAVPAHVEEGAQRALCVAGDDEGDPGDGGGGIRAGLGDVVGAAGADPRAAEDRRDLDLVMGGVGVPSPRQRARPGERGADQVTR
jgi:hypothetical protein